mgnify:CR=1 FL=1
MSKENSTVRNIDSGFRGFIYAVNGQSRLNGTTLKTGDAAYIEDEQQIELVAATSARLMWCFGKPHHEPMFQHGPFVD